MPLNPSLIGDHFKERECPDPHIQFLPPDRLLEISECYGLSPALLSGINVPPFRMKELTRGLRAGLTDNMVNILTAEDLDSYDARLPYISFGQDLPNELGNGRIDLLRVKEGNEIVQSADITINGDVLRVFGSGSRLNFLLMEVAIAASIPPDILTKVKEQPAPAIVMLAGENESPVRTDIWTVQYNKADKVAEMKRLNNRYSGTIPYGEEEKLAYFQSLFKKNPPSALFVFQAGKY